MNPFEITLGDYTVKRTEDGKIVALWHGTLWADYTGHAVIAEMLIGLERLSGTKSAAAARLREQFDKVMAETSDEELAAEFDAIEANRNHPEPAPFDWENPDWEDDGVVHDWKNYVSEEVQGMWDTFTPEQKQALARQAENSAGREEWD